MSGYVNCNYKYAIQSACTLYNSVLCIYDINYIVYKQKCCAYRICNLVGSLLHHSCITMILDKVDLIMLW